MLEKTATINNPLGIHARPAALLVQVAARFNAEIYFSKDDVEQVNGKSIMGVMMLAASRVASFIEKHPTVKMLALSFLMLVGVTLIADGLRFHVPRGYIYFAMGFSLSVEFLNLRMKHRRKFNNAKK